MLKISEDGATVTLDGVDVTDRVQSITWAPGSPVQVVFKPGLVTATRAQAQPVLDALRALDRSEVESAALAKLTERPVVAIFDEIISRLEEGTC